jgi:hypothetical protein
MATVSESQRPASPPPDAVAEDVPTGPAAAVLLAAGFGALALGIATTLAEASTSIKDGLQWNDRVGPLSGKTIIAVLVFFLSWGVLGALWRRSSPPLRTVMIAAAVLIGLGLVATFPIFFQAFADE